MFFNSTPIYFLFKIVHIDWLLVIDLSNKPFYLIFTGIASAELYAITTRSLTRVLLVSSNFKFNPSTYNYM